MGELLSTIFTTVWQASCWTASAIAHGAGVIGSVGT